MIPVPILSQKILAILLPVLFAPNLNFWDSLDTHSDRSSRMILWGVGGMIYRPDCEYQYGHYTRRQTDSLFYVSHTVQCFFVAWNICVQRVVALVLRFVFFARVCITWILDAHISGDAVLLYAPYTHILTVHCVSVDVCLCPAGVFRTWVAKINDIIFSAPPIHA